MTPVTAPIAPATPVSDREVWRLAGPLILSNVTTPLLGIVDTAIVGHLGAAAFLGGVGVGAVLFNFVFWGFGFLRMGTVALTAQARGAADTPASGGNAVRAVLGRAGLTALIGATLVLVLQAAIIRAGLWALAPEPEVARWAGVYAGIRMWAAPATLMNYAIVGWLLGMGHAPRVFWQQIVTNGANTAASLFFAIGLDWGVAGVALGTVVGEAVGTAFGLFQVRRVLAPSPGTWDKGRILDIAALQHLFVVNRDIVIRTFCLISAFAWFTRLGGQLGETTLAANQVLLQFLLFSSFALDAFAHAAEVLVGRAVGARDPAALTQAALVSGRKALVASVLFSAAYLVAGSALVAMLTDVETVRLEAGGYVVYAALCPVVAVAAYHLDGIFIGATRTVAMRNAMAASFAIYIAISLALVEQLGNHGLWLALLAFMGLRALTLVVAWPALLNAVAEPAGQPS